MHKFVDKSAALVGGKGKAMGNLCLNNLLVTGTGAWKVIMTSAWEKGALLNLRKKRELQATEAQGSGFGLMPPGNYLFLDKKQNQKAASKQMGWF